MTWLDDSGYMFCASSCAYAVFSSFYVKVNSDPEDVFLALWRVGNHAEWRSVHSRLLLSLLTLGIWTICYEPLGPGSSCSLFGVWRIAWFDNG